MTAVAGIDNRDAAELTRHTRCALFVVPHSDDIRESAYHAHCVGYRLTFAHRGRTGIAEA